MDKLKSSGNLCFKEDEFLDQDFSVDKFVTKCKDRVTMGTLREDLETHYKNIQLALIELINRDYSDFVSLSSNLIGTDKTIGNLNAPLCQLKEEVLSIKHDISLALERLEQKLNQRKIIRDKKSRLHHLINVVHSVEKIEKILMADLKSPDMEIFMSEDRANPGQFLERVAGEFNQLQFHVHQSKGHPIIESIRPRVALITTKLQENLETTFEQGIVNKQSELVLRCLRTYALIDKTSHAEELFQRLIVKPFVEEVVNEQYHSEHGTRKLCESIIHFIENDCQIVLTLTSDELSKKNELVYDSKQETVKGFDFLVNSLWVELIRALEDKLPLLFSPGNPDLFLKRYKVMMNFVKDFEDHCVSTSSFKHLRSHPTYNSFMIKWSLPVYFQIRFQEIGGKVEIALDDPYIKSPEDLFMTNAVGSCWLGILQCWKSDVYIPALRGRFWKLNLQIVSRLSVFINSIIESEHYKEVPGENIVSLLGDGLYFTKKVNDQFEETIKKSLQVSGLVNLTFYKDALNESCISLSDALEKLIKHTIKRLADEACIHLDNVKNVPRLYRRTNKDLPVQSSSYISTAFTPLRNFQSYSSTLQKERQQDIAKQSLITMTSLYLTAVNDLLTSIKKTEDSLLRLKQQRKAAAGQSTANLGIKNSEVSDENKIRRQIHLDAIEYGTQIYSFGFSKDEFQDYVTLLEMTTKAAVLTSSVE